MFVCHGNICRSPMAELLFKDMLKGAGLESEYTVASSATSHEEEGNAVYPPVRALLSSYGISAKGKYATVLTRSDYAKYDMFIAMDSYNVRNVFRIFGDDPEGKVVKLLDFTEKGGDVRDPYYSGDFNGAYADISEGLKALLCKLTESKNGKYDN